MFQYFCYLWATYSVFCCVNCDRNKLFHIAWSINLVYYNIYTFCDKTFFFAFEYPTLLYFLICNFPFFKYSNFEPFILSTKYKRKSRIYGLFTFYEVYKNALENDLETQIYFLSWHTIQMVKMTYNRIIHIFHSTK